MLEQLLETVTTSLQELVGSGVKLLPSLLSALIILGITGYVAQITRNLAQKFLQQTTPSRSLQLLGIKISGIAAWVIGVLFAAVLAFPGLSLGDLIGTLGLSSVAIGFAFQDIFKNFLAGILLLLQEPFEVGDQIIVGDYEGIVERIDIRTTTLRTGQGEVVLLPNSEVFTSAVQVRTASEHRRTDLAVGVDYNTSLTNAIDILENTLAQVPGVVQTPAPEMDIVSFGDSSIDFLVRYWTSSDQAAVNRTQTQVIVAIKQAFDQTGISIPYPIRSLYFFNQEQYSEAVPKA